MIRAVRVLALCSLLCALRPVSAHAEWQFAPFVGFAFLGETTLFDPDNAVGQRHWDLGGSVRLLGDGILGVEAIFSYVPGLFVRNDDSAFFLDPQPAITVKRGRSIAVMGNIVLTTPRGWNQYGLRPFVSGGAGLLHAYSLDEQQVLALRANLFGFNAGGGAVGFLTDRLGLRFDLRYYSHIPPGPTPTLEMPAFGDRVRLHYWTGTVGVVIRP